MSVVRGIVCRTVTGGETKSGTSNTRCTSLASDAVLYRRRVLFTPGQESRSRLVFSANTEQAITALLKVAAIWQQRLGGGWMPPAGPDFPWDQVRLSLAALLPGMRSARGWVERASLGAPPAPNAGGGAGASRSPGEQTFSLPAPPALGAGGAPSVTLVLAGNTPLLAWSPICACLLAGVEVLCVKLSRDETIWTRLFVESLREVDPAVAERIALYDFPGEDERTYALLRDADAVIAYGSDAAIAVLQTRTPPGVMFFGFGHAVSIGITCGDFTPFDETVSGFARDVLMYDQQGCLSPHVILVDDKGHAAITLGQTLPGALTGMADILAVRPVTNDGAARAVREARDLALFAGYRVIGDSQLRWTVAYSERPRELPSPIGHGFIHIQPLPARGNQDILREALMPVRGIVSSAGVAGHPPPEWEAVLRDAGVSRFCKPGEMQMPPLDWQNGNRDLLEDLTWIGTAQR